TSGANAKRSAEVAQIAARHGLGSGFGLAMGSSVSDADAAEYGVRLRGAFEEAGGVFVKLGQLLATRPDIVPPATANELAGLHQDVEPAPRDQMQPALEAALGRDVGDVFSQFDWNPIGAGSLGQVYRASLNSGETVVVKVRRPGIEASVERDLQIAVDAASFAEERSTQAQSLGIVGLAEQFVRQLRDEMDFRIEARNTIESGIALSVQGAITTPQVFDDLSGETVLVLSLIEGDTLGRHGVVGGERGKALADALFEAEVGAMLRGDRFHGDPHPGNVMITPSGGLGLIDFGSTDRLDAYERSSVTNILAALALNEPSMLSAAAMEMGMGDASVDPDGLNRAFARLMSEHLRPGAEPSAELLRDFLGITNDFGLVMPVSVTGMFRALATLQGSLEVLSPHYPILNAAQRAAKYEMAEAMRPENLTEEVKREVVRLAPMLRRAPHRLDRIAGQVEQGNFAVRVRLFTDEHDVRVFSRLVNRAVLAFVGATLGVVSAMLLQLDSDTLVSTNVGLFQALGLTGLFFGSVLIMRVVLEVLRER
ncbi:MAG: ABC1 kinase family protein, partial [Acidimicrobiia bacterium]